jgi:hypothetical protein
MSPKSHRLFRCRLNGPRVIHTYSRDDLNANRPRLGLLDRFHVCRASAKHENFVLDTQRERDGARPPDRFYYCNACGPSGPSQTSPQGRGADGPAHRPLPAMAQTCGLDRTCRPDQPPLGLATAKALTIPQRQTGARWRARETHGFMPNPRQVACRTGSTRHLAKVRFTKVSRHFIADSEMERSPGRGRG